MAKQSNFSATMIPGWPDAIRCGHSDEPGHIFMLHYGGVGKPDKSFGRYDQVFAGEIRSVSFDVNGKYTSRAGYHKASDDCVGQSIKQLYESGRAFNFITSSALDVRLNNIENEVKTREKETAELREENRRLKEELVQHNSILQHYQEQLSAFQKINKKQDDLLKQHDSDLVQLQQQRILYPSILIGAALVGTKLGPTLLKGGVIGLLIGTAVCDDITDYVTKLIGDTKPKIHQQPPEEDL